MGRIWTKRIETITTLSEIVGYKAGLALNREEVLQHLPDHEELLAGDDEAIVTLRAEDFEDMVSMLLYQVGNIPTSRPLFPGLRLFHKYKDDVIKSAIVGYVIDLFTKRASRYIEQAEKSKTSLDPEPFVKECEQKYGVDGALIALEFLESLNLHLHVSPWSVSRRIEWEDVKQLSELFNEESLKTFYGTFFDQRFIDYLCQNFKSIDKINWRKFEGLVSEFFTRMGFYVQIGSGRNDGGIDVRVWPKERQMESPPLILVQCKRQKEKVQKLVVKALWADIVEEKAASGLIVTTSTLSLGAKNVCTARSYPIDQTNRQNLRIWLEVMRSSNTGVFLGE